MIMVDKDLKEYKQWREKAPFIFIDANHKSYEEAYTNMYLKHLKEK